MFSIETIALSTKIPIAKANPPRVITLMVCPVALRQVRAKSIDSGIDMATINVLRQLPRKSRIINAVSAAAIAPSLMTLLTDALTNTDWSETMFT